jgi:Amt family ammonium transporter
MKAQELVLNRLNQIMSIKNDILILICSIMIFISNVGYILKELGSVKNKNNSNLLTRASLVISISSITFFIFGYGLST